MAADMDLTKFDEAFLGILQHLGKIEPFLDSIFFFLARRTDFFKLMHNREDKMGFPPGVAEQIVMKIFKKYQDLVLKNDPKHKKEDTSSSSSKNKQSKSPEKIVRTSATHQEENVPEPIQTVEVETETEHLPKLESEDIPDNTNQENGEMKQKTDNIDTANSGHAEGGGEKPPDATNPEAYNGAVTDKYCWSQNATDIDVKIPLPKFIKKSKDIEVVIAQDHLKVALRKDPPPDSGLTSRILLDGKLTKRVKCEECMWSLVVGESIQISLEKLKDLYWTALIEGETEIDKTKLDTTRDISEFDDQTQADFQKVMYDHHQKLQGKPTSEEQKTQNLLKQAWDAEGSPFRGTPFDPSRVNISSGTG